MPVTVMLSLGRLLLKLLVFPNIGLGDVFALCVIIDSLWPWQEVGSGCSYVAIMNRKLP